MLANDFFVLARIFNISSLSYASSGNVWPKLIVSNDSTNVFPPILASLPSIPAHHSGLLFILGEVNALVAFPVRMYEWQMPSNLIHLKRPQA